LELDHARISRLVIGEDGYIARRIDDETAARERAKQLVDGHVGELWEGATKLARFEPICRH
jgi:hypothetical protein